MEIPIVFFIFIGFAVGAYGTLIGAGGGFLLVPLLLILFPSQSPEIITSISLAVVFCNALSGSATYARMKRIDYKSGLLFSSATIPGAILGALSTKYIPHRWFDLTFGLLLLAIAVYLLIRPERTSPTTKVDMPQGHIQRRIAEPDGATHTFSYDPRVGIALSLAVGYISSLLGVGGGTIHVPVLVNLLNFPVHIATATSHFILAVTALAATVVHFLSGTLQHEARYILCLAVGVLFGAPVGAWFSNLLHGKWIIRGLAQGSQGLGIAQPSGQADQDGVPELNSGMLWVVWRVLSRLDHQTRWAYHEA